MRICMYIYLSPAWNLWTFAAAASLNPTLGRAQAPTNAAEVFRFHSGRVAPPQPQSRDCCVRMAAAAARAAPSVCVKQGCDTVTD